MLRGSRGEMKVPGGRWSPGVASAAGAHRPRAPGRYGRVGGSAARWAARRGGSADLRRCV